jgi:hypothetical protein
MKAKTASAQVIFDFEIRTMFPSGSFLAFTHAADADAGDDFVHAETGAGTEGQSLRDYMSGTSADGIVPA